MREKVTFSSKDSPRWGQPGFQWGEHINIGNFTGKNNHFGGILQKF